jgi:repressor LexA
MNEHNANLMKEIMERLKNRRVELDISYQELADKTGLSKSTLQRYETGSIKNMPIDKLEIVAGALKIDPAFLMGWESVKSQKSKGVKIPVLGRVAAGIPIEAIEDVIDYEEITEELARTGEFFCLEISGDSMSPRMLEKDVVVVKKQEMIESGEIAVVLVNGSDATVKKVVIHENGISLISINQAYPPKFFTSDEVQTLPVGIIGKVIELRGKF